jgi:hypothetical protein
MRLIRAGLIVVPLVAFSAHGVARAPGVAAPAHGAGVASADRVDGDPASCAGCHPGQHAEWAASRHAAAWIDPVFQAEFAHGRPAWCVGCHAPAAPDPTAVDQADARATRGVGCDGCHLRRGRMVSRSAAPGSPHRTVADAAFGSPDFCASCHEFRFPVLGARGVLERYTDEPMQETVSQWRRSGVELECGDCHAASPGGHAFPGSHRPDMVAAALELAVCRERGAISAVLTNRGAAHHVPSGGVHRRMVLRAWRSDAPERLAEAVFGRRFRPLRGGGKQTVADTTIPPGGSGRLRIRPGDLGAGAGPLNLEVRYIYALDERAALPPDDVSRVILHRRVDPAALPACR